MLQPRRTVRPILSLAAALVAAVGASLVAACGETLEPPLVRTAPLALAMALPGEGTSASSVFSADVDTVRIGVYRQNEATAVDTFIAWRLDDQEFRLAVDVPLEQRVETLYVYVDLLAGRSTRFYASTEVVLRAEVVPALPALDLTYIGPGWDAVFLTVTPRGTTIQPNGTAQFAASAQNGQQQVVAPPIAWSVSDTRLARVSASGLLTARAGTGQFFVKATTPTGLADSVLVNISAQLP